MSTSKGNFINNTWKPGSGEVLKSINPSNGETVWEGNASTEADVDEAVEASVAAFKKWSLLPLDERKKHLEHFNEHLQENRDFIAETISKEVGKTLWESGTEVQATINKLPISLDAHRKRCGNMVEGTASTRFKPHGAVAVFGTFNFPAHISNGHIIPALLAGNTVILKPSEHSPLLAERIMGLWEDAGLPAGVINLLQGSRETGEMLVTHAKIQGVFFTGSVRAGIAINKALAETPNKIVALELGGNNPLVVWKVSDLKSAAYTTLQSAYLTSGQRCTCARRLIIPEGEDGGKFINTLTPMIQSIIVGAPDSSPSPFMGPVVSESVAQELLKAEASLIDQGAKSLIQLKHIRKGTGLISPGLIDVTEVKDRPDTEVFGPLLQIIRVPDLSAAIEEANNTAYGLAAGILTDDEQEFHTFHQHVNAGLINWNQQLTGASSKMPFGGVGLSGNHRPTAFFAADYCSYPVASIENKNTSIPENLPPGISI